MSKRMFLWAVTAILAGALFFIGNPATAQEGRMGEKHEMGMMHKGMKCEHHDSMQCSRMMKGEHHEGQEYFLGMKDELGLSDAQVNKLKALKSESEKQAIRTKADLKILHIELHDLLQQDKVDVKAVDGKIGKIGELQMKMLKAHVHTELDARNILTPEQLKKHQEMKGKRMHGMHTHEMGM